ncbi:MAG: PrsW family intramembrane metalloprotease [Candidatus Pacebacteria bacterium]|nr:PrsW family intramembrane metalloprotease [Candidatus Paceibacterota bacterium]
MSNQIIFYALLGGIIPTIIWLWFWLKEDSLRPEPTKYLFLSFIFGMIAAALVLPVEEIISKILPGTGLAVIVALSFAEEIFKYGGAYFSALKKKCLDEPVDALIYMITAALGFAALENTLFLLQAIKTSGADITRIVLVGNLRFIGATLLHTVSSGAIGLFIALSFYKSKTIKRLYLLIGLILSVGLHAIFNFFIIRTSGGGIFAVFALVWLTVILLIFLFEIIKRIKRKNIPKNINN